MFSFFSKIKSLFFKDDSEYETVRARNKKGRFVADDPKTKKNWKEFSVAMKKAVDKRKEYQKKNEDVRSDTKKHGIKFSDKKGTGRIRGGKKVYD